MNTVPVAVGKTDVVLHGTGKNGVSLDVGTDCKTEALVAAGTNVNVAFETDEEWLLVLW